MGRKAKRGLIIENLEILEATAEGKCMGKHEDKVVFVNGGVPGDIADVSVVRDRRRFYEAVPVKFHQLSDKRQEPICEHFGVCGGCKWQNMQYKYQLFYKQKQVTDNLVRLGKIELPEIKPIIPSENTSFYRNKLEYTFSNKRWLTDEEVKTDEAFERNALGFHIPGRFDKVLNINKCHLQSDISNQILVGIREFALKNKLSFFDLREQHGLLRNIIIRSSVRGDLMVIVFFHSDNMDEINLVMNYLKKTFKEITSLQYGINQKKNDTPEGVDIVVFNGEDHILEEMEGLLFKVGPKSFYQTNSNQAYTLYQITREFAELSGKELVYDLYTGTGTIANFVAKNAKQVIGVEYVPEAIEDAKVNSQRNKVDNTRFYSGDMKDVLNEAFITENGTPDVIITDPPRAGMHQNVVDMILRIAAPTVVYVSCNPATQARDLQLLDVKYKVTKVQPVDMFPHTQHVENVVQLKLK